MDTKEIEYQNEIMSVDGQDFPRWKADLEITRLNESGEDAEVTYPDGARWLFTANGRSIKLNNM